MLHWMCLHALMPCNACRPTLLPLSGLGKVVLSNIRTPKMLMDVSGTSTSKAATPGKAAAAAAAAAAGGSKAAPPARPLEQEPMLAARIMVEDCMLLLCDVEDIDRLFAASAAQTSPTNIGMHVPPVAPAPLTAPQAQALLQRRGALLNGIAASFRLPDVPMAAAAGAAADGSSGNDGVFVRILALPKGRSLIGKTLKLMFTAPSAAAATGARGGPGRPAAAAGADGAAAAGSSAQGLDMIWALLRNARTAFGPAVVTAAGEAERRLTDATIGLSSAVAEMMKRLATPEEALACMAACVNGLCGAAAAGAEAAGAGAANGIASSSQLLPLYPAGRVGAGASPEWLGSILGSLLLRASELGLGRFAAEAAAAPQRGLGDGRPGENGDDDGAVDGQAVPNGGGAGGAAPAGAAAAEWKALLDQLTHAVQLHLWQLVEASRGQVAAVAAAAGAPGPAGTEVLSSCVSKLACVPLMRVLMTHCEAEQADQIKAYLSEIGGR